MVNRIPRLHFNGFAHIFDSVSDSEVRAIKQQSLDKDYQIQILEKQIAALEAESKKTKASLERSRELEEAAIHRRERCDDNKQRPSYVKYFQKYLLGPFRATDEM